MAIRYEKLGFKIVHTVPKYSTPADLFHHLKRRCGIYMLVFPGREHYFGLSGDVCCRLGGHKLLHGVIKVAFFPHPASTLRAKERETIELAVDMGMIVRNKIHNRLHQKVADALDGRVLVWPFPTRSADRRKC
jgi:hypothetical protein